MLALPAPSSRGRGDGRVVLSAGVAHQQGTVAYSSIVQAMKQGGLQDEAGRMRVEQLAMVFVAQSGGAEPDPDPGTATDAVALGGVDDITTTLSGLSAKRLEGDLQRDLRAVLFRTIRIVSRRGINQKYASVSDVNALLAALKQAEADEDLAICADICGALANLSSNRDISPVVGRGAGTVVRCLVLSASHLELVSAAAHCVQAVGMTLEGKRAFIESDAVPVLLAMLSDVNEEVVVPAAGALHNLSTHIMAAEHFRQFGGVAQMVRLLAHPNAEVKRCAAGCLQALSRDAACLAVMKDCDATAPLSALLLEDDIGVQVAAVAALLNIHSSCRSDPGSRDRLKKVLSFMITSSCLRDAYCTPAPSPAVSAGCEGQRDPRSSATPSAPSPVPDIEIPHDWLS